MVENGQAQIVGLHVHRVMACLKDQNTAIQRKAAVLARIIAEEGGASMVVPHVPKLVECFEASNSSLLAPLDALTAIAYAGEANAVAQVISRLVTALGHRGAQIRLGACDTLAAIILKAGDVVRSLGLFGAEEAEEDTEEDESPPAPISPTAMLPAAFANARSLTEVLVGLALDDPDFDVRKAAAKTLLCVTEDASSAARLRERHSLQLFRGVQSRLRPRDEVRKMLISVLGLEVDPDVAAARPAKPSGASGSAQPAAEPQEAAEEDVGEETGENCAICCESITTKKEEKLECSHSFHPHCIAQWFDWQVKQRRNARRTCPLCRFFLDPPPPKPGRTAVAQRETATSRARANPAPAAPERRTAPAQRAAASRRQRSVPSSPSGRRTTPAQRSRPATGSPGRRSPGRSPGRGG